MSSIAAAPHIFWAALFIVLPLIIVIGYAFTDPEGAFTLENVKSLKDYVSIFGLSIELSVIATFICLIIGYPLAYIIARSNPKHQSIYIMLLSANNVKGRAKNRIDKATVVKKRHY